jgi:4-hydroxy-3-methylbut-2-enyl diphosphate reductase
VRKSVGREVIEVTVDPHSGFCFGVSRAIDTAEDELKHNAHLSCLGDIVHNDLEVDRLKDLGLKIIGQEEFGKHKGTRVLIRAHGEPPDTYQTALQNNISLIDATCPIVLRLQKKILDAYREMSEKNGQVVIYGKEGHAEVRGLSGQTDGNAIVIQDENDLDRIDFSRPIRLFSQTTMSTEGFMTITRRMNERINDFFLGGDSDFKWYNTICRQVSNRSEQLREFVKNFQVVLFVSGKKSSNGKYLYELCRNENPRTYFVSEKEELRYEWFEGIRQVGICGATSTPKWLMETIGDEVKKINR